ncbi:MAG: hypothetical protein HY290_32265 [Planctomycetia bacterium]|nr:hypothetical protein [Planctomycetia bacterium]
MSQRTHVALTLVLSAACILSTAVAWLSMRENRILNQALLEQNSREKAILLELQLLQQRAASEGNRDSTELKITVIGDAVQDANARFVVEVLPAESPGSERAFVKETINANQTVDCGVLKADVYELRVTMPQGSQARRQYYLPLGRGPQTVTFHAPAGEEPAIDVALEFEWPSRLEFMRKRAKHPFEIGMMCEIEHPALPSLPDEWQWVDELAPKGVYVVKIDGTLDLIRETRESIKKNFSTNPSLFRALTAESEVSPENEELQGLSSYFYTDYVMVPKERLERRADTILRWRGQRHVIHFLGPAFSLVIQPNPELQIYQVFAYLNGNDIGEHQARLEPGSVNRIKLSLPDSIVELLSEYDRKTAAIGTERDDDTDEPDPFLDRRRARPISRDDVDQDSGGNHENCP